MCGICGTITRSKINENMIKDMINSIKHRGPDDDGVHIDFLNNGTQVSFAQCRLSILDLSQAGHQPMISEDGKIMVVYNGEIYNFKDIKIDLEKKGYAFKSNCDTEVILQGYREYGIDVVKRFNGMFAFSLYDKKKETIYLVRDRMGVKPLYYFYNGLDYAFASELKALIKLPFFKKEINYRALGKFLACQYIPAPETIYENTYKLEPGTILKWENGKIDKQHYWSVTEAFNNRHGEIENWGFDEYKNNLEALLEDAVQKRMIADVPVGTFLSGGVDSSLIAALAQKKSGAPINTFTIGFDQEDFNEAKEARKVSQVLGTNHYEEYCSVKQAKDLIFEIPHNFDEPFADSSQLPTMLLCKKAKQKVTVALSGDAGDELFCGYKNYDDVILQKKYLWLGKIFGEVYGLHKTGNKYLWKAGKILKSQHESDILTIDSMNTADITNRLFCAQKQEKFKGKLFKGDIYSDNIQENKMLYDMINYLPDDILVKVDRASMKYALETRNPFLDYRVVEESFSIPHIYKYNKGNKKYIIKEILYQYVPKDIIDRPKKGFSVPLHQWLHNDLTPLIQNVLSESKLKQQGIFNEKQIGHFVKQFENSNGRVLDDIMWSMLMFQLWYEEYIGA